ncbi:MAG: FAD-binding oxidoreductase, partial [Colwelliaceae bacterium]|nr:FAD-binding oxidoreductase [Colwelliaceae bacterium]
FRQFKGVGTGSLLGKKWQENRFRSPYLRDALWQKGYVVDTFETATDWQNVDNLMAKAEDVVRSGLTQEGEKVHVFTHLSHVYSQGCSLYTTYVYRNGSTFEETLERWQKLKHLASDTIVNNGGTISHQHGVGKDHAPYLHKEKGEQGMAVINNLVEHFDDKQLLNPGTLVK